MSRRESCIVLAVLGAGVFLAGLELMITAVALPSIVTDLTSWTEMRRDSWIVNAYLLVYVATMPMAGRLAVKAGMIVKTSVSKKCDILVLVDPDSRSGKSKIADHIGVPKIAEPAFWRLLGVPIDRPTLGTSVSAIRVRHRVHGSAAWLP